MIRKPLHCLFSSASILLLAQLLALWLCFSIFYPCEELVSIDMPATATAVAKRAARICTEERPKDLLLLGSSLILTPSQAANADGLASMKNVQANELERMLNCNCYQKEFLDKYGLDLNIATLGVPAAMMSDQYTITRALIEAKRMPRLIVIAFGARDFIDNTVSCRLGDTLTSRVFSAMLDQHLDPLNCSLEKLCAILQRQGKFTELLRLQMRRKAVDFSCSYFGRETTLWYATKKEQNNRTKQSNSTDFDKTDCVFTKPGSNSLALSLADYNKRYNPFNREAYLQQIDSLDNILKACSAQKVPVVLVAMPLTGENLQLLSIETRRDLDDQLKHLCSNYAVSLIDMNKVEKFHYDSTLFYDSVHLTQKGSKKFVGDFASQMVEEKSFRRTFLTK